MNWMNLKLPANKVEDIQEAAFVRPRLSSVRSFTKDGHGSLLISHNAEDIRRPKSALNDEASRNLSMMTAERLNKESQEESKSETSYDDESSSEINYERTEVSTDPTVWGRVVLGWLDKECPDPEVLPAIRFAHGDETRIDASLRVYDLTDPVSDVKFSQFILYLRAHVEGIAAQYHTPISKRLSWRSDSIDDDNSKNNGDKGSSIGSIWLQNVRSSSKPRPIRRPMSADSKRETLPAESAARGFVSDIDLVHPQEPSLGAARSKNPCDGVSFQSEERGQQEAVRGPVFLNWKDW
ncbi:hypothetical protein EDD18DRAFT_1399381 [Armillaria luteobubalina]|uniref:Uncharacterized protein n=1 Tax=Armillaria luteobubalina TaxID=153913 RepID=A0AA39UVQ9_9AGAR|nr:hypothetical protein EDD18DRAFT_1399381 [Armillaria luteobubalina]